MQSKGNAATAEQKRYWSELTEMGCLITGRPAEIDHLWGATAKHNKVPFGQWAVIALCPELHRNGTPNRTSMETQFYWKYFPMWDGQSLTWCRKNLFAMQNDKYMAKYQKWPPIPIEALNAIIDYHK